MKLSIIGLAMSALYANEKTVKAGIEYHAVGVSDKHFERLLKELRQESKTMAKKLSGMPSNAELEEVLYTGGLKIGDIVRSSPDAALDYPYSGGIHDKEPYFGMVEGHKAAGRDPDGWEYINPVVKCFDGKTIHRNHYWWLLVNEKELQWLISKYGSINCKRIRTNRVKDYDPLFKEINKRKSLFW